jgi:hypothetical protein
MNAKKSALIGLLVLAFGSSLRADPSAWISVDGYGNGATISRPYGGSTTITVRYDANDPDGSLSGIRPQVWNSTTGYFDNNGGNFEPQSGGSGEVVRTITLDSDGDWYFWADAQNTDEANNGSWINSGPWTSGFEITVVQQPLVTVESPAPNSAFVVGDSVQLIVNSYDPNSNMVGENIDILNPSGVWNFTSDWAVGEPFQGSAFDPTDSTRNASFTFNQPGTWIIRGAAADPIIPEYWTHSDEVAVNVVPAPSPSVSVDGYSSGAVVSRPYGGSTTITVRYDAIDPNGTLSGIRPQVWNSATGYFDNNGGNFMPESGGSGEVVKTVTLDSDGDWYFWTDTQNAVQANNGTWTNSGAWTSGFKITVIQQPQVTVESPATTLTVAVGGPLLLTVHAIDPNGTMTQQNIDIRDPDGVWNFTSNWAVGEPYQGPASDPSNATRSASFVFNRPGTWIIRGAAADPTTVPGTWVHSAEITVNVVPTSVLVWYDIGYDTLGQWGRPNNLNAGNGYGAWAPITPYGWNTAPINDSNEYSSTTPILGPYSLVYRADPDGTPDLTGSVYTPNTNVILQHAYWLKCLGADGMIIDWTNEFANNPVPTFSDVANAVCKTLGPLTDPPKVVFAVRLPENEPASQALADLQVLADNVYSIYNQPTNQNHHLEYYIPDGGPRQNKPVLLVFENPDLLAAQSPQWDDSRFNIRFTNGFLYGRVPTTDTTDPAKEAAVFSNSAPYWNFVEDTERRTGYPVALYRQLPSSVLEQSAIWVALNMGGPNNVNWEGMTDTVDNTGLRTLERSATVQLANGIPLVTVLNRFNYPVVWGSEAQEGLSPNDSTCIEPTDINKYGYGFDIFDMAARVVQSLKTFNQAPGLPPGQPQLTLQGNGRIAYSGSNLPTQYQINGGPWQYVDINDLTFPNPGGSFTFQLQNAFGVSPTVTFP